MIVEQSLRPSRVGKRSLNVISARSRRFQDVGAYKVHIASFIQHVVVPRGRIGFHGSSRSSSLIASLAPPKTSFRRLPYTRFRYEDAIVGWVSFARALLTSLRYRPEIIAEDFARTSSFVSCNKLCNKWARRLEVTNAVADELRILAIDCVLDVSVAWVS